MRDLYQSPQVKKSPFTARELEIAVATERLRNQLGPKLNEEVCGKGDEYTDWLLPRSVSRRVLYWMDHGRPRQLIRFASVDVTGAARWMGTLTGEEWKHYQPECPLESYGGGQVYRVRLPNGEETWT